ncbi:MAG: hypothetical protein K9L02_06245 [Acholeplasmataceae bacterium]|nr:hypothetical protein [Acholeplasmataceae bacterium]
MKRNVVAIVVLGSFALFHLIVPSILFSLGIYNILTISILNFLSFAAIPIFMFFTFSDIWMIKGIAIAIMLATIGFFILDFFQYPPTFFFILITLFLFAAGLTLKPSYYFKTRVGVFLVLATLLYTLKYTNLLYIVFYIIYDYDVAMGTGWDLGNIFSLSMEGLFFLYFLFLFLTLDGMVVERNRTS